MGTHVPPTHFTESTPYTDIAATPGAPRPNALTEPLDGPTEKMTKGLRALGINTIRDLLEHLPRDRREAQTIDELIPGEAASVIVEVKSITSRPVRRRGMKPLVNAVVADTSGVMEATFFNQPWLQRRYPPGSRLILNGKYEARNRFKVTSHALTQGAVGTTVATYPATDGLTSTQILELVREHRHLIAHTLEPLPAALRVQERLPDRAAALEAAHFGDGERGRYRLAFDELLLLQMAFLRRRALRRQNTSATPFESPADLTKAWIADTLPFTPTDDQRLAMRAIDDDLAQPRPMQRLLMGEVGSGKTVVALYAMLRAVENGAQAVLMAPTETLAEQHFATLQTLLPEAMVSAALLTGATPGKRRADLLGKLASGELQLLVGTHAVIEGPVEFDHLAVAVVDEQHRFGVNQRRALDRKGGGRDSFSRAPHILHMTATPIPRTQALTAYGDLDTTILRELPAGRRPISTHVANTAAERNRAYQRIEEEIDAGHQAFIVCPLVEESEALEARAATVEYERLKREVFPDRALVLLHGRMTPAEKQAAMLRFADGDADILVATTVIEVGIDVPNATVMLVEDAVRFGISQLHQLRGRVGRGEHDSVCILFGAKDSRRLQALAEHRDGFKLAEIDLELRGEGELIGIRQSGLGSFRFALLPDDAELLERARYHARLILDADPEFETPENALLADALEAAFGADAAEPIPA
ncbi:MAG: ATP-dependent helicase RecG [Solirubrobacteraceae bacterium]|jgi:ATP-dependent DNA helicase RecG|nr:ATP-dependent helicase RecG [Solirubrobacteraceae bacterium]